MTSMVPVAIRWDAYSEWSASPTPPFQAQSNIGFSQHRQNAPWYSTIYTDNYLQCNESQANMDLELQVAKQAGIKCWAYNWYRPENTESMMAAWRLHQSSSLSTDVNWCILTDPANYLGSGVQFSNTAAWHANVAVWVEYFQQANYQKVLTNRPLLFMFWEGGEVDGSFGGDASNIGVMVAYIGTLCVAAGLGDPYVILLTDTNTAATYLADTGASALSAYDMGLTFAVDTTPGAPYSQLNTGVQTTWTQYLDAGFKMAPTLMTGWSPRAPAERPETWEVPPNTPFLNYSHDFAAPTPAQFATQCTEAIAFIEANASACESSVMLIYAWSECGESGNPLMPTLSNPPAITDGSDPIPTTSLLVAAGAVLRTVA